MPWTHKGGAEVLLQSFFTSAVYWNDHSHAHFDITLKESAPVPTEFVIVYSRKLIGRFGEDDSLLSLSGFETLTVHPVP